MLKIKIIFLLYLLPIVWTYESFNEFPLIINKGDYIINATLTDLKSHAEYYITEYIHASYSSVRGKISISSPSSGQIDVHYSTSSDNERLVIQDNDCNLFKYKTKWDKKMPGIKQTLLSHILLIGPSLIHRYKIYRLFMSTGQVTEIRGKNMTSARVWFDEGNLEIICYFEDTFEIGISQPSRIQFTTATSYDTRPSQEDLILDIYQTITVDEELNTIVTPKSGLGCPVYFKTDYDAIFPYIGSLSIHYTSVEKIDGLTQSTTTNQIYADEKNQLLSMTITSERKTTEASQRFVYDYSLGIVYKFTNNGECVVTPISYDAPGIELRLSYTHGKFSIENLLDLNYDHRYLGETEFENQAGLKTHAWENIAYPVTLASGEYDKVVTTIYTIDSENENESYNMIPVGETIHAYNKSLNGKYSLVETTTKTYHDFGEGIKEEIYESQFSVSDCYPNPQDRKKLALQFDCKDEKCDSVVMNLHHTIRDEVKAAIQRSHYISASRIENIDIGIGKNQITAYVTFLNFPDLSDAFEQSSLFLSSDVFDGVPITLAESSIDCLRKNGNKETDFEAVCYCGQEKICFTVEKVNDLHQDEDNGRNCSVFLIPMLNLNYYVDETPLDKIQNELQVEKSKISFHDGNNLAEYTLERVDEIIH